VNSSMSSLAIAAPLTPTDLVQALKQAWREGTRPDASAALQEHQSLLKHRSLVVDLAYEEYCLREEAGATPDTESFCRKLPAFQSEVREVLRGHRVLADHPELFDRVDVAWPAPGDQYEGYTVVRELGRGAFARAYLAEDPDTGSRPVVLKLSPTHSGEARLLGTVRHPHVAEVHWARRIDGMSAICLRYEGAATLCDVVACAFDAAAKPSRSGQTILTAIASVCESLPTADEKQPAVRSGQTYADAVASLAERLAGALAHLHGRGIIHGDLKPSNVVLGPGGHPYLIDFNLAGLAGESLDRFGGTLPYMAPECVRRMLGDDRTALPLADRSDIYSFGAVLFEALTGRLPLEPIADNDLKAVAADLLRRHMARSTSALQLPNVPRRLAALVCRCLAVEPTERPSAEDLKQQLGRFLNRRRLRSRLLAVTAIGAAIAAGTSQLPTARSTEQTVASIGATTVAEPTTAEGHLERGLDLLGQRMTSVAETHFLKAEALDPDARTAALVGYCRSKLSDDGVAVRWYKLSIARDSASKAWVYNNLAYSLTQSGATSPNLLMEADEAASKAIDQDDTSSTAFHNRAWARYLANLDRKKRCLTDASCLPGLFADLAQALRDRTNPDLFLLAALVNAASSAGHPERLDIAMNMLHEGIDCGLALSRIKSDPVLLAALSLREDFRAILNSSRKDPANSDHNPRLIDPPTH
jgi:eukaryotic-like serine/threonine-protein kinase